MTILHPIHLNMLSGLINDVNKMFHFRQLCSRIRDDDAWPLSDNMVEVAHMHAHAKTPCITMFSARHLLGPLSHVEQLTVLLRNALRSRKCISKPWSYADAWRRQRRPNHVRRIANVTKSQHPYARTISNR